MSQDKIEAYEALRAECAALINSGYILSGNRIMALLRLIADTPALMDYIAECNKGIDYNEELYKAAEGPYFKLPASDKKRVALVTGLLYEFDRDNGALTEFIKQYYGAELLEDSFKAFGNNVLTPYIEAFGGITTEDTDGDDERVDFIVGDSVRDDVMPYVEALLKTADGDDRLSDVKKEEAAVMLDGLYYALEMGKSKIIKVVWTGTKSVLSGYKKAHSFMRSIEDVLKSSGVI